MGGHIRTVLLGVDMQQVADFSSARHLISKVLGKNELSACPAGCAYPLDIERAGA